MLMSLFGENKLIIIALKWEAIVAIRVDEHL